MEAPSREQLLENLRATEHTFKQKPNVFFGGLRKILLGWAHLYEAITINRLPVETAAQILAIELDIPAVDAKELAEMFASIDWSEAAANKEDRKQHGGGGMFANMIQKYPWIEELLFEVKDIWTGLKIMPPQRQAGDQHLVHMEYNLDDVVGGGLSTLTALDRINDAVSRRIGVWAIDKVKPFVSPTMPLPTQLAISLVLLLVELIRMILTILPDALFNWISPALSTIMAFIELARGDWKHAVLTLYGSIKSGYWSSMRWKMVLNTLTLISPETKNQVLAIALNTPRDIGRAFVWWLVTFVMPKQEAIAKVRDLLYVVTGTPVSGIMRLEVQDFYKIRTLFSDSPIFCLTPVQVAIRKITEGDPWYIYLLPESIIKKVQVAVPWPYRKAGSILIKSLVGVPVIAEPATLMAKCGKSTIVRMYELLKRVLDNKDKIKTVLPDQVKPQWQKFIDACEYIDAPDKLLDDAKLSMQEAFGPLLQLKEAGGIRDYFQDDFLKQLESFVQANDKSGFKTWIHKFPKEQILNLNASVKLLEPLIMQETGTFAKEMSPVLKKVAKASLKEQAAMIDPLLSALSHMDNPGQILDTHGVTMNDIIEPIVSNTKIAELLDTKFLETLKQTAGTNDKLRFVRFVSNFPKEQMFTFKNPKSFLALPSLLQEIQKKPLPPKLQAALKNFASPALPSQQETQPSASPSLPLRRRPQRRTRKLYRGRARTRKTRR